jgi:hypothetical protein
MRRDLGRFERIEGMTPVENFGISNSSVCTRAFSSQVEDKLALGATACVKRQMDD